MRDTGFHQESYRGCVIELHADDTQPESPREWCNLGHMVCWHRSYNLGDEQPQGDGGSWIREYAGSLVKCNDVELIDSKHIAAILKKHAIILPLFLYDHSGITMSCRPFSCPWDSGQVGWIVCSMKDARKEFTGTDEEIRAKATKLLESEVRTYDQFLTGDVCGFVTKGYDGEQVDSCWGFYPDDSKKHSERWEDVIAEAKQSIDGYIDKMGERDLSGEHDFACV